MTALQISLSDYTGAWLLYVGLMFVLVVMYAPWRAGRGFVVMHQPLLAAGTLWRALPGLLAGARSAGDARPGIVALIETAHHLLVQARRAARCGCWASPYDAKSPLAWGVIVVLLAAGIVTLLRVHTARVSGAYHAAAREAAQRQSVMSTTHGESRAAAAATCTSASARRRSSAASTST